MPINRLILLKNTPERTKIKETNKAIGMSKRRSSFDTINPSELTKVDIPITKVRFNILAPNIFPTEILPLPFNNEDIPVTNSGRDVPRARKVKLIICFGILKMPAISMPVSTNRLAPYQ